MKTRLGIALVILWPVWHAAPMPSAQATRDAPAQRATGTAVVTGEVLSTDQAPRPVRLARVTLNSVDRGGAAETATTDDNGRFAFRGLPAGRYTLQASRRAWLDAYYGATRPGRPGTAIAVGDGQRVAALTIRMPRGAVITGSVRDQSGEAQPGVTVAVLQFVIKNGARSLVRPSSTTDSVTDDDGVYRAYGLPPGDYVVMARLGTGPNSGLTAEEARPVAPGEVDRALRLGGSAASVATDARPAVAPAPGAMVGNAPVFFPGTTDLSAATILTIGAGEERAGVDVPFVLLPTARISGTVTLPFGVTAERTELRMTPGGGEQFTANPLAASIARVDKDGKFLFTGVPPGRFAIASAAANAPAPGGSGPRLLGWARTDVVVDGRDLEIALELGPPSTLAGRVAFDGGSAPKDGGGIQIVLRALGDAALLIPEQSLKSEPDGTFLFSNLVTGKFMIAATIPRDSPWVLKSALVRGLDMVEAPMDVPAGDAITGMVVTFTDRPSELAGTLQDASGRPATDYFVIVFPADRAAWLPTSRRIQSTRPGSDGGYSVKGLPAGEYLIAALTDVEPGEWFSPAFLGQLQGSAVHVRIADGEKTVQSLKISGVR
jgi:protocatechuate 3,4-dioxygenase beta subunit